MKAELDAEKQAGMDDLQKPVRIVNSNAPTRICDNGGWTDTWFAQYGTVFNIAVFPAVEVQLRVFSDHSNSAPFTINAQNRYSANVRFTELLLMPTRIS